MAGPRSQNPNDDGGLYAREVASLPPRLVPWKPPRRGLSTTYSENTIQPRLPDPATTIVVFSVLPPPAPADAVTFSVLPAPAPVDLVVFSMLPAAAPLAADLLSALAPQVAPSGISASGETIAGWPAPAAWMRQTLRTAPPSRRTKPERSAPSGPRRLLAHLVAVGFGALGVVAVQAVVDGSDDNVGTAVSTPDAETPTSIAGGGDAAVEPPAAPTTTAATAPVVAATTVLDTTTTAVATAVPVVPPPPSSAPLSGPMQFSGSGNFVIDVTGNDLSRTMMVVTHNGVAGFELSTLDRDLNVLAVVESFAGSGSGTYPLGLEGELTPPSYLRVDADGEWTIEVKSVDEARVWQADFIVGSGADVLRFEGGPSLLDYTNAGSSNFIVQYHRSGGFDLLINEIGPISGKTTMQAGPGIVVVDAEGEWALSATPA